MEIIDITELVQLFETSEIDEDDLSEEQIAAITDYYERETLELKNDLLLTIQHIRTMIMDIPIKDISSGIHDELKKFNEKLIAVEGTKLKESAYFLVQFAKDHNVCYHDIVVLWSIPEVIEYIMGEYSATVHEEVLEFSINELFVGQTYRAGHRMGMYQSEWYIQLIHNRNLPSLYGLLKDITLEDGMPLSELFLDANSKEEIEKIIELYNECQDNLW